MNTIELNAAIAPILGNNTEAHIIGPDEVVVFVVREGVPAEAVREANAQINAHIPSLKGRFLIVDGMDLVKLKLSAS